MPPSPRTRRVVAAIEVVALAAFVLLVWFAIPVQAQVAAEPAASAPSAQSATLPAVQVRGRRERVLASEASAGLLGELPLIETPFSAGVVTRALIDKQQSAFVGDLLKNDPSAIVGNVAVPFMLLRGFAVGTDGTLYDGLPGHNGFSDGRAGLQMIDRVEVFKGTSSLLNGIGAAGSLGGVVNYVPKRPTDTPVRTAGASVASRSLISLEADLGDRFGPDRAFGYRVNLGARDGEQGVERYGWNQKVASLMVDWRAAPGALITVGIDHVDNHIPELPPFYVLAPGLAVPEAPDTRRSAAQSWDDFKTRSDNVSLRGDWAFAEGWNVLVQALHNQQARPLVKEARFGSIDNAAGDVTLFGSSDASSERRSSAQALLRGRLDAGGLTHRVSLGASALRGRSESGSTPLGPFTSNLYRPVDSPEPAGVAVDEALTSRTSSRSLFASDIVEFDAQWSALLGVRRARISVDNLDSVNTASRTLPTLALMFKPMRGALLYVNAARGLEQGGSVSPTQTTQFLPPRLTKQVEVGAKLETDGLTTTLALFDMRRPLETFDAALGRNVQRGTQRHRGLELVANGAVTSALTIVAGTMLLDAEISDTGDPASDGRQAIGVPRVMANLWAEYRIAAVPGLAVNAGAYHAGRQYLDGANTQTVPAWTRLDLGTSWATTFGGVPATLLFNVENVADKDYWASAQSGILTMGDPRTVKLGARFAF